MKPCKHPCCPDDHCRKAKPKKKRTPIKKRSVKMKKETFKYLKQREVFLENNPACGVCGGIASDVHHKKGRIGKDLLDETNWLPVCRPCHRWIEEHPEPAKEMGYSLSRLNKRTA